MYGLLHNAQFNVLGLVDDGGGLVERYEYTPYGQRQVFTSAGTSDPYCMVPMLMGHRHWTTTEQPYGRNPYGHQGLYHDEETDLIYNRARMLHPRLGRFTQRDPLGYVDGMSQYAAFHLMHGGADPSGMQAAAWKRIKDGGYTPPADIDWYLDDDFDNYFEPLFQVKRDFWVQLDFSRCEIKVEVRVDLKSENKGIPSNLNTSAGESSVKHIWDNQYKLCESSCGSDCPDGLKIRVALKFVTGGSVVGVRPSSGRSRQYTWHEDDNGRTIAHEIGHFLGNPDEYPVFQFKDDHGTMQWPTREKPRPEGIPRLDGSIMDTGSKAYAEHFRYIADAAAESLSSDKVKVYLGHDIVPVSQTCNP